MPDGTNGKTGTSGNVEFASYRFHKQCHRSNPTLTPSQ